MSATAEQCTGQKCSYYDSCFVFRMRRQAADADVIIVNHHLFFADLALRSSSAGDTGAAVLPKYDAVIFDEAHAVEEVATEHFGSTLSSFRVSELARDALKAAQTRTRLLHAAASPGSSRARAATSSTPRPRWRRAERSLVDPARRPQARGARAAAAGGAGARAGRGARRPGSGQRGGRAGAARTALRRAGRGPGPL